MSSLSVLMENIILLTSGGSGCKSARAVFPVSLVFVIGGSLGLSDAVVKRADEKLSFSAMTFPHQMMRMILCEQIAGIFTD